MDRQPPLVEDRCRLEGIGRHGLDRYPAAVLVEGRPNVLEDTVVWRFAFVKHRQRLLVVEERQAVVVEDRSSGRTRSEQPLSKGKRSDGRSV